LLNVGPTARGSFDYRAQERLEAMGEWMKFNSRSIYNCTEAPEGFAAPGNTLLTYNPGTKRLYVHLLAYPMGSLTLKNMGDKVKYIQFLHDASEIRYSAGRDEAKNDLNLQLPVLKPPVEIPVLEVMLR
jgi:alpha-L-fucosidase